MTYTTTVLRLKTAKAIIARCYEADKSAAISTDGLSIHGNAIDAIAVKIDGNPFSSGYNITINSTVLELATLKSIVDDVYAAIAASKTNS